jgi:hypothetical protein
MSAPCREGVRSSNEKSLPLLGLIAHKLTRRICGFGQAGGGRGTGIEPSPRRPTWRKVTQRSALVTLLAGVRQRRSASRASGGPKHLYRPESRDVQSGHPSDERFAAGDRDRRPRCVARHRIGQHHVGGRKFRWLSSSFERHLLSEVPDGILRHCGRN